MGQQGSKDGGSAWTGYAPPGRRGQQYGSRAQSPGEEKQGRREASGRGQRGSPARGPTPAENVLSFFSASMSMSPEKQRVGPREQSKDRKSEGGRSKTEDGNRDSGAAPGRTPKEKEEHQEKMRAYEETLLQYARCTVQVHDMRIPNRDGETFHFAECHGRGGVGGGLPMIMVHGYGGSLCQFYRMMRFLVERWAGPLYFLDLPGMGGSVRKDRMFQSPTEVEQFFGRRLRFWCDTVLGKDQQFVIVAHSFGAYVSTAFAHSVQERVAALILLSPCLGFPRSRAINESDKGIREHAIEYMMDAFDADGGPFATVKRFGWAGEFVMRRVLRQRLASLPEEELNAVVDHLAFINCSATVGTESALTGVFGAYLVTKAATPLIERVDFKCPLISFYGDNDWMDRQGGAYIGDIGVIAGCTHHMHLEYPRLVTRCIMYFIKHNLDNVKDREEEARRGGASGGLDSVINAGENAKNEGETGVIDVEQTLSDMQEVKEERRKSSQAARKASTPGCVQEPAKQPPPVAAKIRDRRSDMSQNDTDDGDAADDNTTAGGPALSSANVQSERAGVLSDAQMRAEMMEPAKVRQRSKMALDANGLREQEDAARRFAEAMAAGDEKAASAVLDGRVDAEDILRAYSRNAETPFFLQSRTGATAADDSSPVPGSFVVGGSEQKGGSSSSTAKRSLNTNAVTTSTVQHRREEAESPKHDRVDLVHGNFTTTSSSTSPRGRKAATTHISEEEEEESRGRRRESTSSSSASSAASESHAATTSLTSLSSDDWKPAPGVRDKISSKDAKSRKNMKRTNSPFAYPSKYPERTARSSSRNRVDSESDLDMETGDNSCSSGGTFHSLASRRRKYLLRSALLNPQYAQRDMALAKQFVGGDKNPPERPTNRDVGPENVTPVDDDTAILPGGRANAAGGNPDPREGTTGDADPTTSTPGGASARDPSIFQDSTFSRMPNYSKRPYKKIIKLRRRNKVWWANNQLAVNSADIREFRRADKEDAPFQKGEAVLKQPKVIIEPRKTAAAQIPSSISGEGEETPSSSLKAFIEEGSDNGGASAKIGGSNGQEEDRDRSMSYTAASAANNPPGSHSLGGASSGRGQRSSGSANAGGRRSKEVKVSFDPRTRSFSQGDDFSLETDEKHFSLSKPTPHQNITTTTSSRGTAPIQPEQQSQMLVVDQRSNNINGSSTRPNAPPRGVPFPEPISSTVRPNANDPRREINRGAVAML
ncbi:unnamed protein product [Amoebophrya sp. A25]|nr:unnamed protein product [Amoebophrya sp. A25]|eukprot:GSA25T00011275001.1